MVTEIWVNIGSGNGLLPDGTKPLHEPMLTDQQWSPVTFILRQFHNRWITKICSKILCLKFHSNFPGTNELTIEHQDSSPGGGRQGDMPYYDYHNYKCPASKLQLKIPTPVQRLPCWDKRKELRIMTFYNLQSIFCKSYVVQSSHYCWSILLWQSLLVIRNQILCYNAISMVVKK